MRIGITGASGMLGTAFVVHLSKSHEIFATSRSKGVEGENIEWSCFDLINTALLNKWLDKTKPDMVIHCAAMINVDMCEGNVELATKLHVETTKIMVNYLDINDGKLIYISTDSVFDGQKQRSYNEDDLVSPLNVYAETKLMGEQAVLSMNNGLVLRIEIIGWTQKGSTSFAEWILKSLVENEPLKLFHDVYFSPLHIDNLPIIIEKIIKNPIFGLYHCASSDGISKYEFGKKMTEIFQLSSSNIKRVSIDDMEFKADRPKNMALDIGKISSVLSYDFPNVVDAIKLMKYQYDKNSNLLN
jgi:dTDP-4-dehydrorhamnose reductase